jgi:hypothetical protein
MKLLLDENLSRRLVPFLQHDYPGTNQVVLLGMESASDKEVWQKAIRIKTLNQTRAATLKVLIENNKLIEESLVTQDIASVELVP